jgi:signal transduction histidine kinase
MLRTATLDKLGGAECIVRTHLDQVMAALPLEEQQTAVDVFNYLVTPSGTKIAQTVRDLADYTRLRGIDVEILLEKLSGQDVRILRPVQPPFGYPTALRYEIFHDVLAPAILDWRARNMQARERAEQEKQATLQAAEREREARYQGELAKQAKLLAQEQQFRADVERLRAEEEQKRAEQHRQELESIAYTVSHEFRAPLRVISGFARILLEDYPNLDLDVQDHLKSIHDGVSRAHEVVDGMLLFSRAGRLEMKFSKVDMGTLAESAAGELINLEQRREIELTIGSLESVDGDPTMLRQVFTNLISNALKFTRGRTPAVIEIGVQKNGQENVYCVRDNGVGFDMKYADRLFGAFQRLHPKEEFEGTGVGLAITRRIIQRHYGQIWAKSAPNEGSSFYFSLPRFQT